LNFLSGYRNLAPYDGQLYWLPGFYSSLLADRHLKRLHELIAWQTERLFIYGRWIEVPRLMAWYGDSDAQYRYSNVTHTPLPWIAALQPLREDMQTLCGQTFNSVLANLYRHGRDSMGCHADNEKELGDMPVIASLSFGETRLLRFHHPATNHRLNIELAHGDALIMAGELQQHWRHELPKTRRLKLARINLTFRRILTIAPTNFDECARH
jgi:alkylated DNA repair dioxygenase AlkB